MDACGVSPAMFVGHELGYAVDSRPIGSVSGTIASEVSLGSTGQGRVPVESFRFP